MTPLVCEHRGTPHHTRLAAFTAASTTFLASFAFAIAAITAAWPVQRVARLALRLYVVVELLVDPRARRGSLEPFSG